MHCAVLVQRRALPHRLEQRCGRLRGARMHCALACELNGWIRGWSASLHALPRSSMRFIARHLTLHTPSSPLTLQRESTGSACGGHNRMASWRRRPTFRGTPARSTGKRGAEQEGAGCICLARPLPFRLQPDPCRAPATRCRAVPTSALWHTQHSELALTIEEGAVHSWSISDQGVQVRGTHRGGRQGGTPHWYDCACLR